MICQLCDPKTIPHNFHSVLAQYTNDGDRVLGLAYKEIKEKRYPKIQRLTRDVESDMRFLGLLVFENRLKAETGPVIEELRSAGIRPVMVTGDNLLTAVSVARQCGICDGNVSVVDVDKESGAVVVKDVGGEVGFDAADVEARMPVVGGFAMTGKVLDEVVKSGGMDIRDILVHGAVFARMTPAQKEYLVDELKGMEYFVGMCGDGANDCGALRAAHMGISLSDQEASAAAPFTYKHQNVSCIPTAIKEGRAALDASFGVFKFMAGYSLTQFASIMILYWLGTNLSDFQFLYIDMFEITILCLLFGGTAAATKLARRAPDTKLLALVPMVSLFAQVAVITALQAFIFVFVQQQPWWEKFVPHGDDDEENFFSFEGYSVFALSSFQYIWLAIAFSTGPPYRKHFFTNVLFLVFCVLFIAFDFYLTLAPCTFIERTFSLKMPPVMNFRATVAGLALVNFVVALGLEWLLVPALRRRIGRRRTAGDNSPSDNDSGTRECVIMIDTSSSVNGSTPNSTMKTDS